MRLQLKFEVVSPVGMVMAWLVVKSRFAGAHAAISCLHGMLQDVLEAFQWVVKQKRSRAFVTVQREEEEREGLKRSQGSIPNKSPTVSPQTRIAQVSQAIIEGPLGKHSIQSHKSTSHNHLKVDRCYSPWFKVRAVQQFWQHKVATTLNGWETCHYQTMLLSSPI